LSYKAKGLIPVTVPLSQAEYAKIRNLADSDGESVASLARRIITNASVDGLDPIVEVRSPDLSLFNPAEWDKAPFVFRAYAGCYAWQIIDNASSVVEVIRVGQSINLLTRLKDYLQNKSDRATQEMRTYLYADADRMRNLRVSLWYCDSFHAMSMTERSLIRRYNPRFNYAACVAGRRSHKRPLAEKTNETRT
jgi:hypothetical protein